jgi:hypothetical protein
MTEAVSIPAPRAPGVPCALRFSAFFVSFSARVGLLPLAAAFAALGSFATLAAFGAAGALTSLVIQAG